MLINQNIPAILRISSQVWKKIRKYSTPKIQLPKLLLLNLLAKFLKEKKYLINTLTTKYIKRVPGDTSIKFLACSFTQKLIGSSNSMYCFIFILENIRYHNLTWSGSNYKKLWTLFQFSLSPQGSITERKLTVSCELGLLFGKIITSYFF